MFVGSYHEECSSNFWCSLWMHLRNDQQGERIGCSVL